MMHNKPATEAASDFRKPPGVGRLLSSSVHHCRAGVDLTGRVVLVLPPSAVPSCTDRQRGSRFRSRMKAPTMQYNGVDAHPGGQSGGAPSQIVHWGFATSKAD
jgi:hypothetical protein